MTMTQTLQSIYAFNQFIQSNELAVIHVKRDHCSVCHAVLPQLQDLLQEYPFAKLGVVNQSQVEEIAGELSIFTVPVDLIFLNGKEMHRQGRFIDMQSFEHQLKLMHDSLK